MEFDALLVLKFTADKSTAEFTDLGHPKGNGIMKLLVGTDLHNDSKALSWFLSLAEERMPDVLIFLGDFITFQPLSFAKQALRDMSGLAKHVLVIPGNCDQRDILLEADRTDGIKHIHNRSVIIDGVKFLGKGGSITCPSPTPFEDKDDTFANSLASLIDGTDVLVLHQPVYGFRDRIGEEKHVGSKSLRGLLDIHLPKLVLSGHIHEAKGMDVWRGVHFVNPGPLMEMNCAFVNLGDSVNVEFISGI